MWGSSSTSAIRLAMGANYALPCFRHLSSPPCPDPATRPPPPPREMALPRSGAHRERETAMDSTGAGRDFKGAITDFVELVAKALLSGIGVGVAMGLAILVLSSHAQAA